MANFILSASSTADLSREYLAQHDLPIVGFTYMFQDDGISRIDDCWTSVSAEDFYARLREVQCSTSLVNQGTYDEYFRDLLKHGKDVLHIELSSGISGSCFSAKTAADEINAEGGANKVYVVDSLCASSGFGLLVDYLIKMRDNGATVEEARDWAEEHKLNIMLWFTVDDLNFLYRGGRLSKGTAVVGSLLKIKPLLNVNKSGKLINLFKIRGRKNVIAQIVEKMKQDIVQPDGQTVFICHGDCIDDAQYLKKLVMEAYPTITDVQIFYTGPVIAAHSGPGTLALFYMGSERYEQ